MDSKSSRTRENATEGVRYSCSRERLQALVALALLLVFAAPAFAQNSRLEYARATRGYHKPAVLRWGEDRPSNWKTYELPQYAVQQTAAIEPFEDELPVESLDDEGAVVQAAVGAGEKGKVIRAIDIWQDGEPRNRVQLVGGATPLEDPFEELPAEPIAPELVAPDELEVVEQPAEEDPDEPAAPSAAPPSSVLPNPTRQTPKSTANLPCGKNNNNRRDCCLDGEKCQSERKRLLATSIREISLDITPKFDIAPKYGSDEPLRPGQIDADREKRLADAPSRVWKNIAGDTLAEGKLANLTNGRVVVANESGATVAEIPLGELGEEEHCFISAWWRLPTECLLIDEPTWLARCWVPSTYTWKASGLCHKPLYFEHPGLERYGHTTGPIAEPFVSAAHFFVNIALVPYHMGISPPTECEYALGYYRPGSCAPWLLPPFPLSLRGALYQGGVVTGLVYFLP